MRAVVTGPQPGRVLVERDIDCGTSRTFEVVPAGAGECDVTIATDMPHKGGLAGAIERFVTKRMLPRIYREELSQIDRVARSETDRAQI